MSNRIITAFLEQTHKNGLHHDLANGYLGKVLRDRDYAHPFVYYVCYEAKTHLDLGADEELTKLLTEGSATAILRSEVRSAGGDLSGYSADTPHLARAYTAAIVKLAEVLAWSRHPSCEDPETAFCEAMRDFAHDLRWEIGGAAATIFELRRAAGADA